jgi:GNAT superfamily N-acetyltransferase
LLRKVADSAIYGYGWTGKAGADERAITKYDHTFAVRLHEAARGQGLAVPFTIVIVAATMRLVRARRIGLETWASNAAAVNTYAGENGAGAQFVKAVRSTRPTLDVSKPFDEKRGKHITEDTRLYMRFPWSA